MTLPNAALWNRATIIVADGVLINVDEVGFPCGIDVHGEVVFDVHWRHTVNLKEIVVDFGTGWVNAFVISVEVIVIGAREADAKLGIAQSAVVASFFRVDIVDVG